LRQPTSMPISRHSTSNTGLLLEIRLCAEAPAFRLHAVGRSVCVERRVVSRAQLELTQYAVFEDDAQFLQWCDADAIKLSYPLLHHCLRQAGSELFANSQNCETTAVATRGRNDQKRIVPIPQS
jgi:hypothetical protein